MQQPRVDTPVEHRLEEHDVVTDEPVTYRPAAGLADSLVAASLPFRHEPRGVPVRELRYALCLAEYLDHHLGDAMIVFLLVLSLRGSNLT